MKTILSALAGVTLAGFVSVPMVAFAAEAHRSREPASTGYGVCAKGPCLHITHWSTEKEASCHDGHGHACSCPHCSAH